ncbi:MULTISPECIES: acyltransferase [unclassified Curtobacterium]|uniref:acyltransferase family protein n=1 Tax=unclassified Curtobacterium TaxID=257496 RepID=UPI00104CE25F|nr:MULTISPECIES: acyltransferase [unclassified Curtobacterium]TCL76713.1 peptidoglycan/LPS O-acetylase OafA/YrhL [Curtobacterium sp. PhB128]TCL91346.1 peptidoglycan/LPS O-acetylase OafA/YrhL [Curtobacterium sp. PhB138]
MGEPADRLTQLDGLRGLAVLLVVASHTAESVVPYGGVVGVTTFFVLSGFVITRALLDEAERAGRIHLGRFWLRRAARLLPAWTAVLVVVTVAVIVLADPIRGDLPRVLATVGSYTGNHARVLGVELGPFEHTWSLAVEEQFYLVWPLVLILLGVLARTRPRTAAVALCGLVGAAVTWRVVGTVVLPYDRLAYGLDTSAAALLVGALAAFAVRTGSLRGLGQIDLRTGRPSAVVLGVGGVGATLLVVLSVCTLPITVGSLPGAARWVETAAVAVAALVVVAGALGGAPALDLAIARWFGTISYGLYLWHYPLLRIEPGGDPSTGVVRLGLALVGIGVASASWYLLERPVLRATRSWGRHPTTRPAAGAPQRVRGGTG